ncbi:bifunctional 2-polyprenyl-6-hydroxyphenol methylase/3-demethylubiquinol 3-O-methyltransferase UbiG [uncultured Roseobacter sp.]|uniref:class I SAM-dependent methyltransferase n=1 Tax=uncultured Roseobacter sp. TaxID=114847 RepID=UPI0026203965|nr:class I SAM-dependent methyltransferase [uncultured Roseobacter sp.]
MTTIEALNASAQQPCHREGEHIQEEEKMTEEQSSPELDLSALAFEQNHQTFRALNHQMWQIPLISMTLTGGLWFGVSKVDGSPFFQVALLFLATVGNACLFLVIQRLRYVIEQTLNWLETRSPANFVSAKGDCWYNRPLVVRRSFQSMLLLACFTSFSLLVMTCFQIDWSRVANPMTKTPASAYYDQHALDLADSYEGISADAAHPGLANILKEGFADARVDILDVGAGTGRDSAWLALLGHRVVAAEPSSAMLQIARHAHKDSSIQWVRDALPGLDIISSHTRRFDIIVLSAVWMHISEEDRPAAVSTIASLLKPSGFVYITLRLGPADAARSIFEVSLDELTELAGSNGFQIQYLETRPDLLGRDEITWQSVLLSTESKT